MNLDPNIECAIWLALFWGGAALAGWIAGKLADRKVRRTSLFRDGKED